MEQNRGDMSALPEGCIANILSFTTPLDACTLSLVSKTFRSAADSDALWKKFLPSDYQSIISRSSVPSSSFSSISKKQLFSTLCRSPLLIDESKKSFWLDKESGKKCFMLAGSDLLIVWSDTPQYWTWINSPESRFTDVAQLNCVWWLEIRGKIGSSMLSPTTLYAVYLVFKLREDAYGFYKQPIEVKVGIAGTGGKTSNICLAHDVDRRGLYDGRGHGRWWLYDVWGHGRTNNNELIQGSQRPKRRRDGWLEIELGEYFNEYGEDGEIEISLMEIKAGHAKRGLIVQGIEVRPKM